MAPQTKKEKLLESIGTILQEFKFQEEYFANEDNRSSIGVTELKMRYETFEGSEKEVRELYKELYPLLDATEKVSLDNVVKPFKLTFFKLSSSIQEAIDKSSRENIQVAPISTSERSGLKMKSLDPPKFDGSIEKWLTFRHLFDSQVNKNPRLDSITKYFYLKDAVKVPSGQVNILDSFNPDDDNYDEAWKALCERYDDKRKIVNAHLESLFSCKKMAAGTSNEICRIIDSFSSCISALKQQDIELHDDDDFANLLVVYMATYRLDEETMREWRRHHKEDTATWTQLHAFLKLQQRCIDDRTLGKKPSHRTTPDVKSTKSYRTLAVTDTTGASEKQCPMCFEQHFLWACSKFRLNSVNERLNFVKRHGLCLNCFSKAHLAKDCTSKHRCRTCEQLHHTLLHFDNRTKPSARSQNSTNPSEQAQGLCPSVPPFKPSNLSRRPPDSTSQASPNPFVNNVIAQTKIFKTYHTLVSTVSLQVADSDGRFHLGRALLDNGSDTNCIMESFAKKLNLKLEPFNSTMTGVNGKQSFITHRTHATIRSNYEEYVKQLSFIVLDDITGYLPSRTLNARTLEIPQQYQLADPKFNESAQIDVLLNAEVFYDCLLSQKFRLNSGPMLIHTRFGWILGGSFIEDVKSDVNFLTNFSFTTRSLVNGLDQKLEKFFEVENFEEKKSLSFEERYCEHLFTTTTTRDANGKFIVMLPFKESKKPLGRNFSKAQKMSFILEGRRMKDPILDKLYCEYMNDYIEKEHITEVSAFTSSSHYLPHHGVIKMSSTSTKLRPVFNASSVSETGISLNDILCAGPTVQSESIEIVMRFREKPLVMMADVEKMYRQVWVHPSQRDYLRFLWREDVSTPIKHFRHNTVPFGTKSAPFLATRVVKQIAINNAEKFPKASEIIRKSYYVDDLAFGFNTVKEGIMLRDQIRDMMIDGGMKLTKFASNNPKTLVGLPEKDVQSIGGENSMTKILGVSFDTAKDEFSYCLKPMKAGRVTRASVLSEIASIYDPIGWIGPVVLTAKLFMKHIWMTRNTFEWRDILPQEDEEQWDLFRSTITAVNEIRIPRHCFLPSARKIELHGFCDSSEKSYGAVIYALSSDEQGKVQVSILCAKSRVAPKNQKTLARLELCSATLLSKLMKRTISTLDTSIKEVTLWSDSTIVLAWIVLPLTRLNTFVANRVSIIQELTSTFTWKHIRGIDNPADVISRGLMPNEIESHSLWWNGPHFFHLAKSDWPESQVVISEEDPEVVSEMRRVLSIQKVNDLFTFIESRFSRYKILIRTFAYINRFTKRSSTRFGPIDLDEMVLAEETVIRIIQKALFHEEYKELLKVKQLIDENNNNNVNIQPHHQLVKSNLSKSSSLISLAPFIDEKDLIRVGGRLDNCSYLTYDEKHQLILPQCHFTRIMIRHHHQVNLHPGQQALLSIIRRRYWPIKAKSTIRKITHECLLCFKAKPIMPKQFMSDLPAARVTMTPPFANTAIDYGGFYIIKTGITRNAPTTKCYVSMFKCMATGSIHLEVVSDLSSQAFIAALSRFVSRRGRPTQCFTDNGTCFEGADNELKKIVLGMNNDIAQFCTDNSIKWIFTTPRAPHAGGVYESGIKSMKHHLKRVFDKSFNYEQFTTILTKIEAILNSRPLTPMSDDPRDFDVLTPGHFLIGRPLNALPERKLFDKNRNCLQLWQQIQHATQTFWNSWYHDYLHNLQQRPVDFRQKFEVKVGDFVLLVDRNLPTMKWALGRITKLFPSKKSKIIRNVQIITQMGLKERDIRYLCFLPFISPHEDISTTIEAARVFPVGNK